MLRPRPLLLAVLALGLSAAPANAAEALDLEVGNVDVSEAATEPAGPGPDGPAASDGPPPAGPVLEPANADEVLDEAEAALAGEPGAPEITLALAEVAEILPALGGEERRRGEEMLLRPTDGASDPFGDGYTQPVTIVASMHFCAFYVTAGRDAVPPRDIDSDGTPDYVDALLSFAEHSWRREHEQLGWRRPRSDGNKGCTTGDGRSRVDLYAKDLDGSYGYATTDPGQRGNRRFGYLVVDNDMQEIGYPEPLLPLAVTAAHEYNHVIQYSYDFAQDAWMKESTATALEDLVFPGVNDYLQYVPEVANRLSIPLTEAGTSLKEYGDAVWNFFLMKRHGKAVLPRSWAASLKTNPESFAVAAYNRGIRGASGRKSGFLEEFVRFAASLAEWKGSRLYPDSTEYPNVRRTATMRPFERRADRFVMDHTTYRLARVKASRGRAVRLLARAPRRIASGIALVGRLPSGRIVKAVKVLRRGGRGGVRLSRPGRFRRITAVIVNGHAVVTGFSIRRGDWIYAGDNAEYRAGIRLAR